MLSFYTFVFIFWVALPSTDKCIDEENYESLSLLHLLFLNPDSLAHHEKEREKLRLYMIDQVPPFIHLKKKKKEREREIWMNNVTSQNDY